MPKYERFEELPVWQEAARLYNIVLDLFEEPALPFSSGFRHQLDRAALSVSNNIAEGFERSTTNELLSFRLNFLRNLKPDHPLYHSPEARQARGEGEER
jgi:hypothetical protein